MHSQGIYRGEIYGEKALHTFPLENEVNLGKDTSRTYGTMEVLKMIIGTSSVVVSVQKFTMHIK